MCSEAVESVAAETLFGEYTVDASFGGGRMCSGRAACNAGVQRKEESAVCKARARVRKRERIRDAKDERNHSERVVRTRYVPPQMLSFRDKRGWLAKEGVATRLTCSEKDGLLPRRWPGLYTRRVTHRAGE